MTQVMPLAVLLHVVQYYHSCDEINDFTGGQEMQIASTIPASVTVHPVEFQFALGRCADFVKVVRLRQRRRNVEDNGSSPQVHTDGILLLVVLHVSRAANRYPFFSFLLQRPIFLSLRAKFMRLFINS